MLASQSAQSSLQDNSFDFPSWQCVFLWVIAGQYLPSQRQKEILSDVSQFPDCFRDRNQSENALSWLKSLPQGQKKTSVLQKNKRT